MINALANIKALKIKGSKIASLVFLEGKMFKRFYPHTTAQNVFELDEKFYTSNNIKGVIFDIDNTLVTSDTLTPPREILDYFLFLENLGIKIAIVSNNYVERVESFCKDLPYIYVARAWKPFKKNLRKVQKEFNLLPEQICLIGDQVFTDIYGGLRMKFHTVLVTAVGANETKFVAFKRIFEKAVMDEYYKIHGKK